MKYILIVITSIALLFMGCEIREEAKPIEQKQIENKELINSLLHQAWKAIEEEEQERIIKELIKHESGAVKLIAPQLGGKDPYGIYSRTILRIGEPAIPELRRVAMSSEFTYHAEAAAKHVHAITGKPCKYRTDLGEAEESRISEDMRNLYKKYHN